MPPVIRELSHPAGDFFSSLDADSEGEEGAFYVCTVEQIKETLSQKEDLDFFTAEYDLSDRFNSEGSTVLYRALVNSTFSDCFKMEQKRVLTKLADCHT